MKKQLHKLLLLVAAVLFASSGYAYDAKIDGIYYDLNTTDKTASVTYKGWYYIESQRCYVSDYTGDVIIPAAITYGGDTFSVTSIGEHAFYGCRDLTSVTIPSSVTSIGDYAFHNCLGLTSVTIPSSVTSIGNYAFEACRSLTSVTIPSSVTSIGAGAFSSCSGLTSVTIPSSVTSIGAGAFSYCSGLTSVTIPSSVTSIGAGAFWACRSLTSVTIPSSVTSIEANVFRGCSGLTSVTIPSFVTSIGENAFRGCSGLTSVTIPSFVTSIGENAFFGCSSLTAIDVSSDNPNYSSVDGVLYNKDRTNLYMCPAGKTGSIAIPSSITSIGGSAFRDCSGLTSVTIPSSVTSIGDYAFHNCLGLTSVTIPSSVTSIGNYAFEACRSLTSVTIPSSVTSIGGSAFRDCSGLTSVTIPSSVTSIGAGAFSYCSGLTSVTIPSSITSIGGSAFSGCSGLTSVTIPSSVTSIGENAFRDCSGLTAINVSSDNSNYSSVDGVLYNKEQTMLIMCPGGNIGPITIPSSVTSIGYDAFEGCNTLRIIYLLAKLSSYEYGYSRRSYFYGLGSSSIICAYSSELEAISRRWNGIVMDIDIPYFILIDKTYLRSVSFSVDANKHASGILKSVKFEGSEIAPDENGMYTVVGLDCGTSYDIAATYQVANEEKRIVRTVKTNELNLAAHYYGSTQMTATFSVSANSDMTFTVRKKGIICDGVEYYCANDTVILRDLIPNKTYSIVPFAEDGTERITGNSFSFRTTLQPTITLLDATQTSISVEGSYTIGDAHVSEEGFTGHGSGSTLTLRGLKPNTEYRIEYYVRTENGGYETVSRSFKTKPLQPTITALNVGPTSISVRGSYAAGDAEISGTGFTDYNIGNALVVNGLRPDTKITVKYYVQMEDGYRETVSKTFTTLSTLSLTTLQPRGVSGTCSIVAAETNIGEEETNAGFQWKKYDAPASLKPNEGYAAVYDGKLEGYVRNLQSTSYYNVRAFYKSAEGYYYYGDWVTFDPSDFSYFSPTVHTYAADDVTHSSARVRGYVLAGTDAILGQGFEYWPVSDGATNALHVKAAVTDDSNVQTVLSTGQVMTAELRDLRTGTTYCCRAFVKTATRTTYGETQTFTTEDDPTGIDDISIDTPAAMPTVTGYYDLSGRKSDTPHHGVNIVRYSDGTARKVIMK